MKTRIYAAPVVKGLKTRVSMQGLAHMSFCIATGPTALTGSNYWHLLHSRQQKMSINVLLIYHYLTFKHDYH